MRYALAALLLAAGCGDSIRAGDEPEEVVTDYDVDIAVDPEVYNLPKTSELETEKTRPIAKTIEWPEISTKRGETYVEDAVAVHAVRREDADHSYGVRVVLKNTTKDVLKLEYLIRFTTRTGAQLGGYLGSGAAGDRWTPFVIEPLRVKEVGDFCRITGAEGFKLFVRAAGASSDGAPDDPSKAEERRRKREGKPS